ncbi:MAG: XRE family transcriptional regulator [Allomuricauda sp.]|nr:MAG: XRE family transcriptional regulator [Allomuricauda sp.]
MIAERLKTIIDHYALTSSSFADRLGVQRSSLSHILNGRNKPSLDFVIKVDRSFPEVALHWLLYGEGSFPSSTSNTPPLSDSEENLPPTPKTTSKKWQASKIAIFYEDGTFEFFSPKQ